MISIINVLLLVVLMLVNMEAKSNVVSDLLPEKAFLCEQKNKIFHGVSQNHPLSLFNAGVMFYKGYCTEKNIDVAYAFFVSSANEGYVDAYHTVAVMQHAGVGVKQDLLKSNEIFGHLLERKFLPTIRYVCSLKEGKDERLNGLPVLESMNAYNCNE